MTICQRSHLMRKIPADVPFFSCAGELFFCKDCYLLDGFVGLFLNEPSDLEETKNHVEDNEYFSKRLAIFKNLDLDFIRRWRENFPDEDETFDWSTCDSACRSYESVMLICPIMCTAFDAGLESLLQHFTALKENEINERLDKLWTYLEVEFNVKFRKRLRYYIANCDEMKAALFVDVYGECAICYDDFDKCMELTCKHRFHPKCIRKWKTVSKVCPLCRQSI